MQNNFEPIDPSKVIVDTEPELIDPRKVVIHPAMSAADRRRVYNSFSGDPLAFIADEGERLYLRHVTEQLPDRDEYRKRMALAAYFTHENKGSDFSFNMHNLDGILESFYRRKISVDEAYSDFQKMHGVEKGSMLKELPGVLKENLMEDLAALGAGSLELASTLAATYLKVAKWGSDLQASILSPLMSEEQKKMAFRYGKLLENIGQEVAVKENRRIIQKLDKASNANPEFVTDLFTGDFDQVSARDFTKALARSAPSMAFQILAGAAAGPWLLPTIIGTQTVAMKDYEVNDKHPEWDGSKKWSYIGLSAANEALFEIVTSKIVGGKMSREAGAKLIQQGLLKYMGKSFAKEGGSEGAQQLLSNITDLVYDIDGNRNQLNGMQLLARVFAGVPEAGFIGGVWGFPEGVTGYFSARRVAGIVNDIRVKHEKSATELSAKDELSDAEAAQLEVSRKILEAGTPQEMLALDHINDTLKKVQEDEDIQNSPTYRDIEKTAAYATSNEELVAAVKAERKNSFDVTATWNVADVADAVTDISKIFKDTVFHVVDNWQNVADIPNLDVRKRAAYNIETGEVYINAAAVRPHEVPQIILHEVVGHKGLRSVLKGADLDSVLDQVYRDHCQEQSFKDIAAKYFKPVELVDEDGVPYLDISLDKIGDQRLAAEEYIAHIAETKVKPKWWKEVLQKVRMAFAKVFGKEFRMSDNQIETLLARASRKVRRNRFGRESSVVTVNTATDKQNLDVDGQDGLRFAALRKQGDPNNAEQKGKLVDGHVPHADGFMEWAGLKGKSLYADYEFLYSRHYRYFKNPQETRAAVELVLAKPEQVADIKGNISFVGFDEVTGDIYRIEINPDIKGQANHIRSIFKITASNYNEIKLEQPRVLQPSKTALHKGGSATMTISNFIDNISQFSENASAEEFRFSIADFSEEQQRNIMDILSPFVGDVVERDREEYADYLASRGVKNVSPDDAFHFALEIVRRKHLTALAARRAKRDNWLYDNILEYKWAVDFSGSSSFQIKLSPRFRGKDTSGTFWLGKKDKGTPVINLDELARYVADEIGGNELDIEQQLFDFYNDLTWVELRKEYTKYRKEMIAADRDADRQAKEEFLEQEKFRIQDEIVQIFSDGKPVVNEQWINENRDVFKELYKKIFPDRNPPYTPSQADIEAINMALVQESGNADVYAQAFKDAKEKAWQQYSGKLKELREKVLSSMTDAVRLQREAVAFAQKNLPKANQSEFVRNIVGLLEYSNAPSARFPEGRRKTEFDKIIARMTERAAEVRKTELLDKIAKRLQQLGERTDSGRRVRGMRDIDTQRRLNRIIAISRLDAGSLNMAITENQKKIEELLSLGADTSELEYDIALLNRYGTLWNKSAGEVNTAFEHLQMLARSGKDNLLAEINKRAADDEYDRNELWRAVNGGRRYNDIEQKTLADKNTKSARAKKNLDKTFWQSLSFDGMLEAMALFANDENVVNRFRQMAHEAKLAKDVLNSSNSDDCHEFLKKLLKTKSPFTIAEKIGKWREIQVQTGVKRFVPDPDARQFEYERLSVDQARVMLQNYDAGKKICPIMRRRLFASNFQLLTAK
ncbi:MAG: hypothetical protein IKC77_07190 [Lentisphaeria bacterium]|nr:hypothetical protein [Lentisphaeria bacterium]